MKAWALAGLLLAAGCGDAARPVASEPKVGAVPELASTLAQRADGSPSAPADAAPEPVTAGADVAGEVAAPAIVEWPLKWSEQREALTLEYRRRHQDAAATDLAIAPRVVVLHYTAGGSAKATKRYFDRLEIEGDRAALAAAGRVNVSSHFLVDRDGTIYRLQPETQFARHCIGLNHVAIGVENVGDEARWPLTEAQVLANVALVRYLASRYSITHLLGHHEVMEFRDHPYFQELDPTYRNRKGDPGARFMAAVRAQLGDLGLAGA